MDIARPASTATMDPLEKGKNPVNSQGIDSLSSVFGRSVDEMVKNVNKELIPEPINTAQTELTQNQLETMALSGQGHCMFYADCTECLRFQTLPINESKESNAESRFAQEYSHSGYLVIVNTDESCQRIKIHNASSSPNSSRTPGYSKIND